MSVLQKYKDIRDLIGHEKYDMIENYLSLICNHKNMDKYFEEINKVGTLLSNRWNEERDKLKEKYGVLLLDDVLYKEGEWEKYESWYNEKYLHRNIEILSTWTTDYDDIRCNAILYQGEKEVANIIASYDETDIRYSIGDKDSKMNEEFVNRSFKNLIYSNFDSYLQLPKISECSKLLQNIYDNVCESDATMCHITDEDWNDFYVEDYTDKDFKILELEVEKFGLQDVIGINDGEYKIIGYGDLEMRFNDDRNLSINKESEIQL